MGLGRRESNGGGLVFADIKGSTGEILVTVGKDADGKAIKESYDSVSGRITDISVKTTEFQGDTIVNLRVKLEDGENKPVIASFALGSFFAAKLVGLLNAADFNQPFKLDVGMMKEGMVMRDGKPLGKDTVYAAAYQGDKRLVPVYLDGKTELPEPVVVRLNGKDLKDMAPVNGVVEQVVKALFERIDAMRDQVSVPSENDGVSLAEAEAAAAIANKEAPHQRAAMSQRG